MKALKWAAPAAFVLMVLAGCNPSSGGGSSSGNNCEADIITDGTCIIGYSFNTDRDTNVLVESPWYAYDLNGAHKIFPNFRVYAVRDPGANDTHGDADDIVTLFQLSDYYNNEGASGHVTLRYRQLAPTDTPTINSVELDASSSSSQVFVSFATGTATVVQSDDDYDLAFSRLAVSVADGRQTALAAEQSNYYDSEGDPIKSVFEDSSSADKPGNGSDVLAATYTVGGLTFGADELDPAINREGTDKIHEPLGYQTNEANPNNILIVRSSEGDSFAKMSLTNITYNGAPAHNVTLEAKFFVQSSSDDSFSETAVTWTANSLTGASCFDFDSGTTVGCAASTWDVQFDLDGTTPLFLLNGGVSGNGSAAVYYGEE